nr:hypothetical protein BaRGS_015023 [Batillaria attramentaria]
MGVDQWWVFSSYSIEQLVKKRLDERLWDIKPPFLDSLELNAFTTGEQTPSLRNVQVFEYCEGVQGGHKPITWFNISKPPAGLDKMSSHQLVVQCDAQLMAEDFRMIFRARMGTKKVNVGFDMAVEELQVSAAEDVRYTVLKIGDRKRQTLDVPATEEWSDVCTFFIYNLGKEEITIKSKCKRLLTSTTLEQKTVNLSSFPFQVKSFADTSLELKDGSQLELKMQYTALPTVNLEAAEVEKRSKVTEVAGVMYVCIHGASNVKPADKTGASDPYCVLFSNRRRNTYSFFVFDWDGSNTIDDDFLGVAHLSLRKEETSVVKRTLTLGYNRPDEGFVPDKRCGQITVSLVFRPVASVAKSERFRDLLESFKGDEYLYREDLMSPATVDNLVRKCSGFGFSDPFCIVSMNGKKVFTTSVKKKTLFPKWNEMVTLEMKQEDAMLTIDVFDKDMISKDFLGKVTLTAEKLKELSVKGTPEWFVLERANTGKLQIKCQVISKDTLKSVPESPGSLDISDPFDSPQKRTSVPTMNRRQLLPFHAKQQHDVPSFTWSVLPNGVNSVNVVQKDQTDTASIDDGKGETDLLNTTAETVVFEGPSGVDRGHGISADAVLVFDIKHSSREHVATKGFSLRQILDGIKVIENEKDGVLKDELETRDLRLDNSEILARLASEFGVPNVLEHDMKTLLDSGDYSDAVLVFSTSEDQHHFQDQHHQHAPVCEPENLINRRAKSGEEATERALRTPARIVLDESVIPRRL